LPHHSIAKLNAINAFLSHRVNGYSVFELADPEVAGLFSKDYKSLISQTFKWDDIGIPSIEQRANFVNYFNQSDAKILITGLKTAPLEQLFPLKFLNLITDCPDYSFGQPIYNQSLNFYTYLLDFFIRYYLNKDLKTLDKLDSQDIETYSPLARHSMREKNRNNSYIREKYFNDEFDVHKFAIKLVEKFVPGATWRWIGGNHKAHVYCIKICKLLMEYGLLDETQCEEIKNALYLKIPVYRSLETIIDRDASSISEYWVNIWYDGLKAIREYYCEILINYVYMKKDNEILAMMQKLMVQKEKNENITLEFLQANITFEHSQIFEEAFSKKMMEFLHGYVLSQNTINKKSITNSMKMESIIDNFLQSFSNIEDPYLRSLRMLRDQDFENFLTEMRIPQNNKLDLAGSAKEISKIRSRIIQGTYTYKEAELFKDIENVLDQLNEKLNFINAIKNNTKDLYHGQRALFNLDIPMSIELILACFCNEIKKYDYKPMMMKFSYLIQYFLKDNIENHSIHWVENNFWNYENMLYVIPEEISNLLYVCFQENSQAMYAKEYILDVILCVFGKQIKLEEKNLTYYKSLSRLIDIIALHHQEKYEKIYNWIPEYDIRITMDLVTYSELLVPDEIEKLLENYSDNPDTLEGAKLNFLINALNLIQISTRYRFVETSYKKVNEAFTIDRLTKLIKMSNNNIEFRKIFFDLYANIHVDFKDHLINNRADYYFTKPADMQYEEDPFYDKEYNKTLDLISEEIKWIFEKYEQANESFTNQLNKYLDYLNESVIGTLVKLMNYFLIIKEGDLHKMNKYISKLEEVSNFLFDNKIKITVIYGLTAEELDSPERKKLEIQLAKIDENQKIKKEKVLIISHCQFILETCSFILAKKPLISHKRKLLNYKDPLQRTDYSFYKLRHFAKTVNERKENLNLIYEKFQRRLAKNKDDPSLISRYLALAYEQYKLTKMSSDSKRNYYLKTLGISPETVAFSYNLCNYIHNFLKNEWNIDKKINKFSLIECLCNMLFISPITIQDSLYKIITESTEKDCPFLDKIWSEMKWSMSYVKFKTNIDKFWKEGFRKVILIMKFHNFLCKGQKKMFKDIFREKILPSDTIDRVQRWTTVFQRMSDNCEWHYNYNKGEINTFGKSNRAYLIPLAIEVFENLSEVCSGNFDNKNKVYTYIYDRYNGILKRFFKDANSKFYNLKLALIKFILVMTEGMNPDILNYQITNFELTNINVIIINSLKQLYHSLVKKDKLEISNKLSDYLLKIEDYPTLVKAFETNPLFQNHVLLMICKTLFHYILKLKEVRLKYENFCREREDMIANFEKTHTLSNKYISEEDFVSFMFLNEIVCRNYYKGKNSNKRIRSNSEEAGRKQKKIDKVLKEKTKDFKEKLENIESSFKTTFHDFDSRSKEIKEEVKEEFHLMNTKMDNVKDETKDEINKLNNEIGSLKAEVIDLKTTVQILTEKLGIFLAGQEQKPEVVEKGEQKPEVVEKEEQKPEVVEKGEPAADKGGN